MNFVPFAKLSDEEQTAAIQQRPTLHLEPVMVHCEGAPIAGPQSRSMGVYHLQLGDVHTVLRSDELAVFLRQIENASRQLRNWSIQQGGT